MSKSGMTKREALRAERARKRVIQLSILIGGLVIFLILVFWFVVSVILVNKGSQTSQTPTVQAPIATVPVPDGSEPRLVGTKQYSGYPPMMIDVNKTYTATVRMAKGGEFVITLFPDKAPLTVNSFVFLAREGYFDGVTFHRVLEGFMAQGGDPTGSGSGGPGYQFANELNDLKFDQAGVVAMANAGRDTNGSQFFIMFGPYGLSESDYTIFGLVTSGMDVVNNITLRDPSQNPNYQGDMIESIVITEK